MFPISDDDSDRVITPYVNYLFIAINILVFVFLQGLGGNEQFSYAFSLVPKEITSGVDLTGVQIVRDSLGNTGKIQHYATPLPVYFNFLSSMFMHGSVMHIFGNMLFLWIFGDNIENLIGHIRYAIFYIVCGFAAALSQVLLTPDSIIPMLGASGAISGVLGGYILLFPTRRVHALLFNIFTTVPAYVALGLWIGMQLLQGYLSPAGERGVAYAAHIGGFIAGLVLIKIFALGTKAQNISPGQG
jgi:membrane associated rhomboid family serine protease